MKSNKQRTFYLGCLAAGLLGMALGACSDEKVPQQVDMNETTASAWTISVTHFPSMDATTRADGEKASALASASTGKTAWEDGDVIELTFDGNEGTAYSIVYQEEAWDWKDDKAPEGTDYTSYTAVYKGGGADYEDGLYEYLTASGPVEGTTLSISLTRNYSRLRITNIEAAIGSDAPLTVNFPEGKYTSPEGNALTSLKVTTDQGGYCVYGMFEKGCRVNMEYDSSTEDATISGMTGYSLISAHSYVFKINSVAQYSYLLTYAGVETVKVDLDQFSTFDAPLNYGSSSFLSCKNYKLVGTKDSYSLISKTFFGSGVTTVDMSEMTATNIGNFGCYYCQKLTSIVLPPKLTAIPEDAFSYCSALTTVYIPEGVTSIGDGAFYRCSALTSVNIPDGITTINSHTFYACYNLTTVNIHEGVTWIGSTAFGKCSALTTVTLPSSLTRIGGGAFADTKMTSITLKCMNIDYVGINPFENASEKLTKIILDMEYDSKLTNSSSDICKLIRSILNSSELSKTNISLIVPDTYTDKQIESLIIKYIAAKEVKRVSVE